jgi:hypothetical protein
MANEINIQATLTLQRYSPALQGVGNLNNLLFPETTSAGR